VSHSSSSSSRGSAAVIFSGTSSDSGEATVLSVSEICIVAKTVFAAS